MHHFENDNDLIIASNYFCNVMCAVSSTIQI